METLESNISKCVVKNITFAGKLGSSAYTVQDLLHSTNLNTLNDMYQRLKKELAGLDGDSLFKTSNTNKKALLRLKVATVEDIFNYKQSLAENAKRRAEARAEAEKKLILLTHAQEKAEIDRISSLSPKKLAKEIQEAEKLANTSIYDVD